MSQCGHPTSFMGRNQRYGQTKFANAVFTHALATKQSKVKCLVAHPGICVCPLTAHQKDGADEFYGPAKFNFVGPVVSNKIAPYALGGWSTTPDVSVSTLWEVSKKATGAVFPFE
ncbi:hypothetical protein TrLO_g1755 [Triparma laevis f. longispina]|uniref:Uncharacterized protein n=1 Tax=Triparma laevis f. longispina TaxID=1714387 RepID=A0A9W7F2H7_9STRA|nr:hypothetical protein TrLO_g1755 [Triparma laevis f. longispina]